MFGNGSKDENNAREFAGKNYQTLREANVVRQAEWDPSGHAKDLFWRMNELAGETGELCNVLKKLYRERVGVPGSRATKDQLAEEAADVIICIDLLAIDAHIKAEHIQSLSRSTEANMNFMSLTQAGTSLAKFLGKVADQLDEYDLTFRSTIPVPGSRDGMMSSLAILQAAVMRLCKQEGVDLMGAVAHKFNATTHKVGLSTFLRYEPG